jgi:hypothetical protein
MTIKSMVERKEPIPEESESEVQVFSEPKVAVTCERD